MDNTKKLPTVISFCSGYGGLERGLDLAGLEHRVIAYVEIEAFAIANLVAKMESGQLVPAPIYTDLKTFPAHLFRDCVDIITGGYPCQPFSAAGKRLGTEDPRHLWPFIRRHIESIRPVRCFFENVEGHISLGLSSVISDLEEDGYRATWGIFSAREVGAPHQRKRVYILANAKSQRYGARREKRDIYQENGRQNWECVPEPAIASTRSGGEAQPLANILGHSQNNRCAVWRETIKRERSENHIKRPDQDLRWQSQRSSQTLANSVSEGSQGRLSGREDTERESQRGHLGRGGTALQRGQEQSWPPEPRLGRVVDGCPDRVDRIRLLGNGIVPQTAAKAWTTLNDRIKNEH